MSSLSETGHARNVANFERVVTEINAMGAVYNPSKASIKAAALNAQLASAKAALSAVNAAESTYKLSVSSRNFAFVPLSKLVTRINSALKISDTNSVTIDSSMTLVRKLQGRRASPKTSKEDLAIAEAAGNKIVEISASRMSYDNRLDNFDKLIKQLSSITAYAPNEADLKIAGLMVTYTDLKTKNTAVNTAATNLNIARINRNDILYKPLLGIADTSSYAKTYIKSVYGATSAQFRNVSRQKIKSIVTV